MCPCEFVLQGLITLLLLRTVSNNNLSVLCLRDSRKEMVNLLLAKARVKHLAKKESESVSLPPISLLCVLTMYFSRKQPRGVLFYIQPCTVIRNLTSPSFVFFGCQVHAPVFMPHDYH